MKSRALFPAINLKSVVARAARLILLLIPVNLRPLLQDRIQQRTVDLYVAVVTDEAQFPEFVHEGTDARSRRADHFRQRTLIETRIDGFRAALLAEIGEQ